MKTTNKGLYIHIPFCTHLCSYCDFTKMFYSDDLVNKYLEELVNELNEYDIKDISSIYIGGGTPSSLNDEQLEFLFTHLDKYYQDGISYAFEANVENLSLNKIKLLKKHHVNRVSLGVQTFNPKLLKLINRFHDKEKTIEVINNLINVGIKDINIDLIYGLPTQTIEDIKSDLEIAVSLPITHISTYSLMVNEHTKMYLDGYKEMDEDKVREYYDYIVSFLKDNGIYRYEVSNFARPGFESKHNLVYWRNEEYYGIGLGASGYLNNIRYTNTKSINKYLEHNRIYEQEELSQNDIEFYDVMLGLRLREGIEEEKIKNKEKLEELLKKDLLVREGNRIKVNDKDLFILDYILRELL